MSAPATLVIASHERAQHFRNALASGLESVRRAPTAIPTIAIVSAATAPQVPDGVGLLHRPDLRTAVAKRGHAFDVVQTPWLVFLDDDCTVTPDAIATMLGAIAELEASRVAAIFVVTEFSGARSRCFEAALRSDLMAGFDYANFGGDLMWGTTSLSAFRCDAIRDVGAFPADELPLFAGGEDVDACLRLRRAGWRLYGIPETLALHTTATWSTFGDNARRSRNYGAAEAELVRLHPDTARIGYENLLATMIAALALLRAMRPRARFAALDIALLAWLAGELSELHARHREALAGQLAIQLAWSLAYELGRLATAWRRRQPWLALRRFDWEAGEPVAHPFAIPRGVPQRLLISAATAVIGGGLARSRRSRR